MEDSHWVDETTLEARLRKGLRYQDGEEVSAEGFRRAFEEVHRVMPEAHGDHPTATPGAPRSTTYGHDPYQALSVFLCAPQAVDAVNRYVSFDGYATTFELAETEVAPAHWSRR